MLLAGKALDAAVWAVLVCCNWVIYQCQGVVEWWLENVLGTWEESVKSIIRESFAQTTRLVNGIFAWLLAVFTEPHHAWHHPFQRSQAWRAWWRESRPSTFNAIIARDRNSNTPQLSPLNSLRNSFSARGAAPWKLQLQSRSWTALACCFRVSCLQICPFSSTLSPHGHSLVSLVSAHHQTAVGSVATLQTHSCHPCLHQGQGTCSPFDMCCQGQVHTLSANICWDINSQAPVHSR